MRCRHTVFWIGLLTCFFPGFGFEGAVPETVSTSGPAITLYDPAPAHLWNRLHGTLLLRTDADGTTYGDDVLDPLLWSETKHLLTEPSHGEAMRILQEFLKTKDEALLADPLRRALFQRDLWAVFDWAANRNRFVHTPFQTSEIRQLTKSLARVIQRIALTSEEIGALPDNYAQAVASRQFLTEFDPDNAENSFLPPDLFTKDGPWVCIRSEPATAPVHLRDFGGRSTFFVFIRLPGGRQDTLAYLEKLNAFPEPWIYDPARLERTSTFAMLHGVMPHLFDKERPPWVNPDTPQFPVGTQLALVRKALLIDDRGHLVPSPLVENVQLRVYQEISYEKSTGGRQAFFEYKLRRKNLLHGNAGGLHAVKTEDWDFSLFLTHGIDPFEVSAETQRHGDLRGPSMNCMTCHDGAGIHSVLSRSQLFNFPRLIRPPELIDSSLEQVVQSGIAEKKYQASWGWLQGLWVGPDVREGK